MKVYLIRHGQSEANLNKMHAGWSDTPLTLLGESQARCTRPLIEGIEFSKIYVSDLIRARKTAEIIFGGKDMEFSKALREINMEKISNTPYSELERMYGSTYIECRKKWDFSPLGCESVSSFMARTGSFFDALERNSAELENVAIVAHAGIIRSLAHRVIGIDFADRYTMKIDNASVSVLEYLHESGWRILHWNYTPQL